MKTLRIYFRSKIAHILFFKNKNEITHENFIFGFHLLETHVQCKYNADILFYEKEIEIKNAFSAILTKRIRITFSPLFSIYTLHRNRYNSGKGSRNLDLAIQ